MIYVAQGYEESAGLSLFLRAISCYPQEILENFCLVLDSRLIQKFVINNDYLKYLHLKIPVVVAENKFQSPTQSSLETCLELIQSNDILFTLPTQKNQLIINGQITSGYTEFLRKFYKLPFISMCFQSHRYQFLLLTDHIPLKKVGDLTKDMAVQKIENVLNSHFFNINSVSILGINPHAGEGGLIGTEDHILSVAISELKKKYKKINFSGPIAGDSSLLAIKQPENTLFVSPFHDQGLSLFKASNGLIGANISLGLPYVRLSVDHGTAPNKRPEELSINGMIYCINLMMKRLEFNHGIK